MQFPRSNLQEAAVVSEINVNGKVKAQSCGGHCTEQNKHGMSSKRNRKAPVGQVATDAARGAVDHHVRQTLDIFRQGEVLRTIT